jgi:hypothetical protein
MDVLKPSDAASMFQITRLLESLSIYRVLRCEVLLLLFFTRDGGQVQRVDDSKSDILPVISVVFFDSRTFFLPFQLRLFSCNNRIMPTLKGSKCLEGTKQITQ